MYPLGTHHRFTYQPRPKAPPLGSEARRIDGDLKKIRGFPDAARPVQTHVHREFTPRGFRDELRTLRRAAVRPVLHDLPAIPREFATEALHPRLQLGEGALMNTPRVTGAEGLLVGPAVRAGRRHRTRFRDLALDGEHFENATGRLSVSAPTARLFRTSTAASFPFEHPVIDAPAASMNPIFATSLVRFCLVVLAGDDGCLNAHIPQHGSQGLIEGPGRRRNRPGSDEAASPFPPFPRRP